MIHTNYRSPQHASFPRVWSQPLQRPRERYETVVIILSVLLGLAVIAALFFGYLAFVEYMYIREHPFGVLNG